jgi:hypothetical protein
MSFIESKPLMLDMKCGCGAALVVECSPGVSWEFAQLMDLAKAWTAAHRAHHTEPPKPEPKT